MTSQFFHHPDGIITIDDGAQNVSMPLATFVSLEPAYVLAPPYTWQYYVPAVTHELHTATDQFNQPLPWADGDTYISKVAIYKDVVDNPVLTLPEAKAERQFEVRNMAAAVSAGGLTLFTTTMPSGISAINPAELLSYELAGATPVGYYKKDTAGAHVLLTLAQLQEYNDGEVELALLAEQNADAHIEAIELLTTVLDVENYDISTGWPTVPYTP
jgi:hypothetical protein